MTESTLAEAREMAARNEPLPKDFYIDRDGEAQWKPGREPLCLHLQRDSGRQRMPLRYGSAATEVCRRCGAWRYNLHGWSGWRLAADWAQAMEAGELW